MILELTFSGQHVSFYRDVQLLHGMENTTNLMLAQFTAGLVHFADYKRCKVMGDLLGVDDPTRGPPLDHRSALFLYRLLAELRSVRPEAGVFGRNFHERMVHYCRSISFCEMEACLVYSKNLRSTD